MPAEVKRQFEERTGARLVEGYGLTESSGVVSTNPYQGLNKPGTIGQPLPATLVTLVDKEDPTRPPPPGEPGEIVFSGPQVMKGYWNRPDADADIFIGRGLRTGDVGQIDEDGYIRIVDRLKDMIAVSGYKVFPSQLEAVLYRHEAVREALVIGIPDHYSGERPKAFVTLAEGSGATRSAARMGQWPGRQARAAGRRRDSGQPAKDHDRQIEPQGAAGGGARQGGRLTRCPVEANAWRDVGPGRSDWGAVVRGGVEAARGDRPQARERRGAAR